MGAPLRVAFVLPDLAGGGAQSVILTLSRSFGSDAITPYLLVPGGPMTMQGRVGKNVELIAGTTSRLRYGLPWVIRKTRKLKPDIIVSVMGYLNLGLLAAKSLLPKGVKVIVREANGLDATLRELPWFVRRLNPYARCYASADAIVSPSLAIAHELQTAVPQARDVVQVIPNPVDVNFFREKARIPKRVGGNGLRLVAAGRLRHQKGFDRLLEIVSSLPNDSRIDVFGDGPDRKHLEQEISNRNLNEQMVLRGYSDDVSAWIAGADGFILPSRWEGLPNIVLESLSVGTPAIMSSDAAGDQLASLTTPGAVSICGSNPEFTAAIVNIQPRNNFEVLRASLLPIDYEQNRVSQIWLELLQCLSRGEPLSDATPSLGMT